MSIEAAQVHFFAQRVYVFIDLTAW